jgi:uncharacterized lipoprotein NlpE involved in copper resistance
MINTTTKCFALFLVFLSLMACSDKDDSEPIPVTQTKYLAISNNNSNGAITAFLYPPGEAVGSSYGPPKQPNMLLEGIDDAEWTGRKIYAARTLAKVVDILDEETLTVLESITYSDHLSQNFAKRRIATGDGKIFVTGRDLTFPSFEIKNYLFAFDESNPSKFDSIPLAVPDADVRGMVYSNGHLFVSWGSPFHKARIEVIDPDGLAILKTFTLTTSNRVNEMVLDRDENVMAFSTDSIIVIDAQTLGIKWKKKFISTNASSDNYRNLSSLSFDFPGHTMYAVQLAAQPASAPHVIYRYDLDMETLQPQIVTNNFVAASTINFEPKSQTIMIGYSNQVTVLDTSAVIKASISVPYTITEIMVKR